jgi:hypothetical protein
MIVANGKYDAHGFSQDQASDQPGQEPEEDEKVRPTRHPRETDGYVVLNRPAATDAQRWEILTVSFIPINAYFRHGAFRGVRRTILPPSRPIVLFSRVASQSLAHECCFIPADRG